MNVNERNSLQRETARSRRERAVKKLDELKLNRQTVAASAPAHRTTDGHGHPRGKKLTLHENKIAQAIGEE
jgi:hypothetical protein